MFPRSEIQQVTVMRGEAGVLWASRFFPIFSGLDNVFKAKGFIHVGASGKVSWGGGYSWISNLEKDLPGRNGGGRGVLSRAKSKASVGTAAVTTENIS